MLFLKKNLPLDTPVQVEILERKGTVQGDYGPKVAYVMKFNGVVYDHEATATEESSGLALLQVGETVACKKVLNKYGKESIYWTAANGSEARGLQQNTGNTRVTAANNQAKEYEQAKADEAKKKEMGYAKSQIGNNLGMSTKLFFDVLVSSGLVQSVSGTSAETDASILANAERALELAYKFRPTFNKKIDKCYAEDFANKNGSSPDTSVKVELPKHIGDVFGEDPSTSLPQAA
jgi:hypothetical protein